MRSDRNKYPFIETRKAFAVLAIVLMTAAFGFSQENGKPEIFKAIEAGDIKAVKKLVKGGTDLNEAYLLQDEKYAFYISRENYLRAIGVKQDRPYNYVTALQYAAIHNQLKIAKYLIKKRANLDARDTQGKTALMYALWQPGGEAFALELIKRGANYVARDNAGSTALHYAAFGGNAKGIHMTFGGGCRPNDPNDQGITPLHAAAMMADVATLEQLTGIGADVELADSAGMTALHYAVAYSGKDKLEWLVNRGAKVNAIAHNNYSPLDLAKLAGNEEAVNYLKAQGAKFHAYKFDELCKAAENKGIAKVRALLDDGANPNCRSDFSPLHIAARAGSVGVVELLLDAGADVNAPANGGETPLEIALIEGNVGPAIVLVRGGAGFDGENVAEIFDQWANSGVKTSWEELISLILEDDAEINTPGGSENLTPIQYAAWAGSPEMVDRLLEKGSKPEYTDEKGWNALHWTMVSLDGPASREKKQKITVKLLATQMDLNKKTEKPVKREGTPTLYFPPGSTPLDVLDNSKESLPEVEKLLVEKGVKRNLNASDYVFIGDTRLEENDFRLAKEDFSRAILLDPKAGAAYLGRGIAMAQLNLFREAERDLDLAVKYIPENPEVYFFRGVCRFELKNHFPAEEDFANALELGTERLETYWYRGQNWLKIGQKQKACNAFAEGANKGSDKARKSYEIHCDE